MRKDVIKSLIYLSQENIPYPVKHRETALPMVSEAIITIPGVRRCGKSSLMMLMMNALVEQGVPKENLLWLGFDDERLSDMQASDLDEVLQAYREIYPEKDLREVYMFFDEIQLIKGWELFVIRVYKSYCKHLFISGSNAQMLSREISTTLRGWALEQEVFPLSFREYCQFKGINTQHRTEAEITRMKLAFDQYNAHGGFPEVVLSNNEQINNQRLQGYYNAMLFRDMVDRYKISNTEALRYFLKRLMTGVTKPASINAIYNDLKSQGMKVAKDDLYAWADYACEIYLFIRIPKYSTSIVKQQNALRKYYVIDSGLRRAVLIPQSGDDGKMLENNVLLHLYRQRDALDRIFYYQGNGECDFVVQRDEAVQRLIQVTWEMNDPDTRLRELEGLVEASEATHCENLTIVTRDTSEVIEHKGHRIVAVPAYMFMMGQDY